MKLRRPVWTRAVFSIGAPSAPRRHPYRLSSARPCVLPEALGLGECPRGLGGSCLLFAPIDPCHIHRCGNKRTEIGVDSGRFTPRPPVLPRMPTAERRAPKKTAPACCQYKLGMLEKRSKQGWWHPCTSLGM